MNAPHVPNLHSQFHHYIGLARTYVNLARAVRRRVNRGEVTAEAGGYGIDYALRKAREHRETARAFCRYLH